VRCFTLNTPDLLLRVLQSRPKYGLTLTQHRLRRILCYLVASQPNLSSSSEASSSELSSSAHFTTALSLLPICRPTYTDTSEFPARTDPVIALCLVNLALSLPIPQEQSDELQAAITDISSHLPKRVTADKKRVKKFPRVERQQISAMLRELKSNIDTLSRNGMQIRLPSMLAESLKCLPTSS
jgi:hypothetical protein